MQSQWLVLSAYSSIIIFSLMVKIFLWVISLLQRVWLSSDNHTLGRLKTLIFGSWLALPQGCDYLRKLTLSVMPNCLIIIARVHTTIQELKLCQHFHYKFLFQGSITHPLKKKKSMFCGSIALNILVKEIYFFNRLFLPKKLGPYTLVSWPKK